MRKVLRTAFAIGTIFLLAAFVPAAIAQESGETTSSTEVQHVAVNTQKPRLVVNFKKPVKDEIVSKGIKNQVICKNVTEIGSRLGTKEVCATAVEWALRDKKTQQTLRTEILKQAYTCGKG